MIQYKYNILSCAGVQHPHETLPIFWVGEDLFFENYIRDTVRPALKRKSVSGKIFKIYLLFTNVWYPTFVWYPTI